MPSSHLFSLVLFLLNDDLQSRANCQSWKLNKARLRNYKSFSLKAGKLGSKIVTIINSSRIVVIVFKKIKLAPSQDVQQDHESRPKILVLSEMIQHPHLLCCVWRYSKEIFHVFSATIYISLQKRLEEGFNHETHISL